MLVVETTLRNRRARVVQGEARGELLRAESIAAGRVRGQPSARSRSSAATGSGSTITSLRGCPARKGLRPSRSKTLWFIG